MVVLTSPIFTPAAGDWQTCCAPPSAELVPFPGYARTAAWFVRPGCDDHVRSGRGDCAKILAGTAGGRVPSNGQRALRCRSTSRPPRPSASRSRRRSCSGRISDRSMRTVVASRASAHAALPFGAGMRPGAIAQSAQDRPLARGRPWYLRSGASRDKSSEDPGGATSTNHPLPRTPAHDVVFDRRRSGSSRGGVSTVVGHWRPSSLENARTGTAAARPRGLEAARARYCATREEGLACGERRSRGVELGGSQSDREHDEERTRSLRATATRPWGAPGDESACVDPVQIGIGAGRQ